MSAVLRVTGEDLWSLSTQLNALADDVRSFPFRNVGGMSGCGSSQVATTAGGTNDHFELRSLLIETELRDVAAMAVNVAVTMSAQDSRLASGSGNRGHQGPL